MIKKKLVAIGALIGALTLSIGAYAGSVTEEAYTRNQVYTHYIDGDNGKMTSAGTLPSGNTGAYTYTTMHNETTSSQYMVVKIRPYNQNSGYGVGATFSGNVDP